jgi:Uma2 family endonuclease
MSWPEKHPVFSPSDYLAFERAAETRHEYLDGIVYAMVGESPEHSQICFNLAVAVGKQLKSECRGYSPNMKVRTDESGLFAYPDLMVVCGDPIYHDNHPDVLLNPTVIVEVLSLSTERYDRSEKFLRYRTHIASLKQYVLVAQHEPHIELFSRKQDDSWSFTETAGIETAISLTSIGCELSLAEIYRGIVLPSIPPVG